MKSTAFTLLLFCFFSAQAALAAVSLKIAPVGEASLRPFALEAVVEENNTAWFDAEAWLGNYPGVLTWDAADKRFTLDNASSWIAIKAQAPFAMRDGRPLDVVAGEAPRMIGGRLAVSEGFILRHGAMLLGVKLSIRREEEGQGRIVVIDPAFGGDEPGGSGVDELLAKDVLLSFAKTLAEALEKAGYRVHLTRRTDEMVSVDRRASIANYWDGDIFLSLQTTGRERPQARGFQLFFPQVPAHCEDAARWECAQWDFAGQSRRWADALGAELGRSLETFDLGVTGIANPLMEAVHSPAALVVVGNLSWPQEADIFLDETQRRELSEALIAAVDRFFRENR